MDHCLTKAHQQGLALVGVRHSTTLEMMAYYAMRALEHQTIGFAATNTELKIGVPPWGGVTPALGNNPFAIAIPGGRGQRLCSICQSLPRALRAWSGKARRRREGQ